MQYTGPVKEAGLTGLSGRSYLIHAGEEFVVLAEDADDLLRKNRTVLKRVKIVKTKRVSDGTDQDKDTSAA